MYNHNMAGATSCQVKHFEHYNADDKRSVGKWNVRRHDLSIGMFINGTRQCNYPIKAEWKLSGGCLM